MFGFYISSEMDLYNIRKGGEKVMVKNEESGKHIMIVGLKLLHYLISIGLFAIFWLLWRYGSVSVFTGVGYRYNYFIIIFYGMLLLFFNRTYNAYLLGYSRIRECVIGQFLSQLFSVGIIYFMVSIAWNHWKNPFLFIVMLIVQGFFDCLWSYYGNVYYFTLNPRKKTLLIYRNKLDKRRFGGINGKPTSRLYEITDELMWDGKFEDLQEKLKGYDAIFVAGVNSRCRNGILKYCKENNIVGFFLPHVGDLIMREAVHIQSFDSPVLYVSRTYLKPEYRIIKRLFDIVSSGLGIIVLSPIMLITALAIKLYDGGPAIYKQVRLTIDGKEFEILKFRSMKVDAEKDGIARLSTGDNDNRITPIGRIVRKFRLDELPQLFNIFKGDMSVVGPRPERPEIAEQYYKTIPDFKLRLQVKAGLTGYAQVYGKYNTDPYEKLQFDLLYINNMNFLTDIMLIFATFSILGKSDSVAGVDGITAMDHEKVD